MVSGCRAANFVWCRYSGPTVHQALFDDRGEARFNLIRFHGTWVDAAAAAPWRG